MDCFAYGHSFIDCQPKSDEGYYLNEEKGIKNYVITNVTKICGASLE